MAERNFRQRINGKVISNKMNKTVVVEVLRKVPHPLYKKQVNLKSRFKAHDEENACQIGDEVWLMQTRPISKEKCWRVVEIVKKGNA